MAEREIPSRLGNRLADWIVPAHGGNRNKHLGPVDSGRELERGGHAEERPRADSLGTLPLDSTSYLHRNSVGRYWHCTGSRTLARLAGFRCPLGQLLLQSAPRRD